MSPGAIGQQCVGYIRRLRRGPEATLVPCIAERPAFLTTWGGKAGKRLGDVLLGSFWRTVWCSVIGPKSLNILLRYGFAVVVRRPAPITGIASRHPYQRDLWMDEVVIDGNVTSSNLCVQEAVSAVVLYHWFCPVFWRAIRVLGELRRYP